MTNEPNDVTGRFCYDYPRPAVTVDIALLHPSSSDVHVLLIRRSLDPWKGAWALPGGYVEQFEPLEDAAARELKEETGIDGIELRQIGAFGDPGRDPRGRTISVAYGAVVDSLITATAGDDADAAQWVRFENTMELAFDHSLIIRRACELLINARSETSAS